MSGTPPTDLRILPLCCKSGDVPEDYTGPLCSCGAMECRAYPCDGSSLCIATSHIHGCFADRGNCDSPGEHEPYAGGVWR